MPDLVKLTKTGSLRKNDEGITLGREGDEQALRQSEQGGPEQRRNSLLHSGGKAAVPMGKALRWEGDRGESPQNEEHKWRVRLAKGQMSSFQKAEDVG